jgi:histidinol-phosphate phosphatase family protein
VRQAVILAGGKGTRLKERLGDLPKPLVDVCGVPLLERQLRLLEQHAFTHALVLVNHAAQRIVEFCASRAEGGLRIACVDDGVPRGTAGATLGVFDRLAEEFLVIYGDTMLEVDLDRFHAFHAEERGAAATLFVHPNDHPHDSDLVEADERGRIVAFHGYPHDARRDYPNLVNAALYWMKRDCLAPWRGRAGVLDFGKDVFPAMLERGLLLRAYESPEYIKDIGTPARLDKVCADLRSGRIARASLAEPQPVVFLDRDGTVNREVDHLRSAEQLELLPGAAAAIRRLNASGYRCCIVTNQPVIARGDCTVEELRAIHNRMETLLGREGAFVDRIYYCPHHPDRGFPGERAELKIDCDCRKPKTGMIERAVREFNVARERSWLIGDGTVEIETARRARLKSILVETGYAGLDYRAWATPDAVVPDLGAAVSFILERYPALLAQCAALAEGIAAGSIVLIGGQARSGKSTLAHVLRDALRARGLNAVVLSVDRWLRSQPQRGAGVAGRYDLSALQALLDQLADAARRPRALALPGYHKLRRERVEDVESAVLAPEDVIVLEGTVALFLEDPPGAQPLRLHVESDEARRRERILREYRLRGQAEAQALEVYSARRDEEYPAIESAAASARRIRLAAEPR